MLQERSTDYYIRLLQTYAVHKENYCINCKKIAMRCLNSMKSTSAELNTSESYQIVCLSFKLKLCPHESVCEQLHYVICYQVSAISESLLLTIAMCMCVCVCVCAHISETHSCQTPFRTTV